MNRLVIAILLLLALLGCQNPVSYGPTSTDIVVLGDSIAFGTSQNGGEHTIKKMDGTDPQPWESCPGMPTFDIQYLVGWHVLNFAVGGTFTSTAVQTWKDKVLTLNPLPKVAYIHTGVNDIRNAGDLTAMMDAYGYFRASGAAHGIKVILDNVGPCTSPCFNSAGFATDCQILNTNLATLGTPGTIILDYHAWATGSGFSTNAWSQSSFDGLHPDFDVNYDWMVNHVIPIIKTFL